MAKTMTKSATLAHLAEKTSLSKKQIEGVLDEIRRYETAMGDQTVLGLDGRPALTVPGAAWSGT